MGKFSEQFIQQVAQATDIVELIGQYVALKKKGREFIGLCPFHDDKHPSLTVVSAKQILKYFPCGAGGGVFKFVELYEKVSFPEAVRTLAERAHIPLPRESDAPPPQGGMGKQDLVRVTAFAAAFFREQLRSPGGRDALEYAHSRGLTDATIERFGLGYAPDNRDEAVRFLEAQGFSREHLKVFAVAGEKEGRWYDYFRERVMFPIIDRRGRVIGFGGRVMDASQPKYLNSPETPVFNKRLNLFGMNLVQQIRNLERLVIVEGYMDVISMHQAGVPYTVASLGTALTEEQARLMRRYASEVFIAYDGDSAGQKATLRSLDILRDAGLNVKVIEFPDGLDPDDYARQFKYIFCRHLTCNLAFQTTYFLFIFTY
jgi:DNA primase